MSANFGNLSMQDAVWYAAQLESEFQASTRILRHVDVIDIGNNKTYTGQVLNQLVSNLVGETERPVFQWPSISTYTASVSAYECPCFIPDVTLSNIQFGGEVLGEVSRSVGAELGRRADRVFISGMNASYDTDCTLSSADYLDVQTLSNARSNLGAKAVRGNIICLLNYDQFSNLLLDQRFSNWFFNDRRPLAEDYGEPAQDYLMRYQGILFIKLSDNTPLPKSAAGKRRLFMFSRESCKFLSGIVEPYGNGAPIVQFQVHRGGYDVNTRKRMGFTMTHRDGALALEVTDGLRPPMSASAS
jgi:hypothetical protein